MNGTAVEEDNGVEVYKLDTPRHGPGNHPLDYAATPKGGHPNVWGYGQTVREAKKNLSERLREHEARQPQS